MELFNVPERWKADEWDGHTPVEAANRLYRFSKGMIHTLKGETVDVNGYFVQRDLDDNGFYLTNLDVIPSD